MRSQCQLESTVIIYRHYYYPLVEVDDFLRNFEGKIREQEEDYWRYIKRLVVRGRLEDAVAILELMERTTSSMQLSQTVLVCQVMYMNYGFSCLLIFFFSWKESYAKNP